MSPDSSRCRAYLLLRNIHAHRAKMTKHITDSRDTPPTCTRAMFRNDPAGRPLMVLPPLMTSARPR